MSGAKHTPGPWRVNKYGSVGAGDFGTQPIVATAEPLYGAEAELGEASANARLIAAATDLLAMLHRVSHLNSFRELNDLLPAVRAALARAEGRS